MTAYSDMIDETRDFLGREPNIREKDHIYIMAATNSHGYLPTCDGYNVDDNTGGNYTSRRIAKSGNLIDWQSINAWRCGDYIGFIEINGEISGQFLGERRYRIPLSEVQCGRALMKMAACISMLEAVEQVLELPLSPIQRSVIRKVMLN